MSSGVMQVVFQANNGIEAQLIRDMLEREDIFVRVDGELLQGGVGELQALGLVRVLVPEAHVSRAREIIAQQWDEPVAD
jgi:hypothetical protein